MTPVLSSASREHWRTFDAEAQLLARALRAGRLTVLVGALGVGKTTLLSEGVRPLLRRRAGDERQQPGDAPQGVVPFPDRRSRVQGRAQGERHYFVDQWNEAQLDSLARSLDAGPVAPQGRFDLAKAMSPAHLSALSHRHGGARLLFVFDHFELLLKGEPHNPELRRFVEAWAAVVQAPDLVDAHFLVAVDEHAWPRLHALGTSIAQAERHAFRLQARSGHRVLESLTDDQQRDSAARDEVSDADFKESIDAIVFEAAQSVREEETQRKDFAASLGTFVESLGARLVRDAAAAAEETLREDAAAESEHPAGATGPAETQRAREAVARAAEAKRAAQAAEAARKTAADPAAAERAAEVERVAGAQRATEAAQAMQRAEAARQAEAARLAEAHRLALVLAAAEAAAARELQARQAAEAAAKSAQAEQRAEAARRAEAERNAEAAKQIEAARRAEAQRLAQALAAAKAAAAREVRARQDAEAALAQAASVRRIAEAVEAARAEKAMRATAEADARRAAEAQQRAQRKLATAGARVPAAATAHPVRKGLLWGAVLLVAALVAVLWRPTRPTPPAAPVAPPPVATAPASPKSAAEPSPADVGRYDMLMAAADGSHARIARELAVALSTDGHAIRLVPLPGGADPITGLQSPGRLAIARLDALRAARGSAAPPLRVLTPLFPEAVLFVVRADSPLKYIHDLGGRRLSIGPVQSDGSHTVREIYRRLFGTEITEPAQLDNDRALAELVAFRSIDAMAIVVAQPLAWWAALDPSIARRLRLLTLDPRHPADRRLLQTLGTPVARIGAGATKGKPATTPAVMSYLVASGEGGADADRLTAMASALCRELPRLRKQGDPKWRELQPMAQLDTGWPVVRPFQSTLSRCARR